MHDFSSTYGFDPARKEWIGVVFDASRTVHTIGCERTEAAIEEWCAAACKALAQGQPEPPDMYDAARLS